MFVPIREEAGLILAQMARIELFWIFLDDFYSVEALKKLNLEGFDWSSRHAGGQTILVRHVRNTLGQPAEKFVDGLETLDWLIRSGASIEQTCTRGEFSFGWTDLPDAPPVSLQVEGLNAISFARALQKKMRETLEHWKDEEAFLAKVLESLAEAFTQSGPNAAGPRVSIHEGIAELWEKSLAAKDSHDLTIETADGVVTAHAHMLKAASLVVRAMLESPMKEGKTQRIEIKDMSSKAVSLFLEILGGFLASRPWREERFVAALNWYEVRGVVCISYELGLSHNGGNHGIPQKWQFLWRKCGKMVATN